MKLLSSTTAIIDLDLVQMATGSSNVHVLGLHPWSCISDNPSSSLYNLYIWFYTFHTHYIYIAVCMHACALCIYSSYTRVCVICLHYSLVGPILLTNSVKFVLTKHFSQDPVQSYFGEQRSRGHHNTNPNEPQFSTTVNILNVSTGLSREERGSVRGRERDTATTTSTSKLRKRKQKRKPKV